MDQHKMDVINLPVANLQPFPDHPFQVTDDEEMERLADNIRYAGVLTPILVRQIGKDIWQIISGHRRKHACELCGRDEIPAIVLDVNDDEAIVMMVDSNFQRERILPSEKAKAYKMKYDAMKHQGRRTDLSSDRSEQKYSGLTSRELLAETSPDSSVTIARYLRLNELIPELMDLVDQGTVTMTPAVELSFLKKKDQEYIVSIIEGEQVSPTRSQAKRLHTYASDGRLTEQIIRNVLLEQKKPDRWKLALTVNKVSKYFPVSYSPKQMEDTIIQLLTIWKKQEEQKETDKEE